MKRLIFHVDVNSAFLSWQAKYELEQLHSDRDLRLIPSAVGGDPTTRHGIVLAKSTPAKNTESQPENPSPAHWKSAHSS